MNIVEQVRKIVNDYPEISKFTNDIHVDFTDEKPTNFGIYPNGDKLISEDILGNQKRQHSFVLYANKQSVNDYDRIANSSFMLELNYYLETICDIEITAKVDETEKQGTITKMIAANGMLYDIPTGQVEDGIRYQIQIYAEYDLYI